MSDFYIPYRVNRKKSHEGFEVIKNEGRNWGIELLKIPELWQQSKLKGKGVKIAIIDSGMDVDHLDLQATESKDFTIKESSHQVIDEHPRGHGTHIAGIIAAAHNQKGMLGIAPEASLYIAKVVAMHDDEEVITQEAVYQAIQWAIEKQVHIINISLASHHSYPKIAKIIELAIKNQIIVVCGAGNSIKGDPETYQVQFPANLPNTIAVGAVRRIDRYSNRVGLSSFSPTGNIDVVAPGEYIVAASPKNSSRPLSGTSISAPFVTGALALFIQKHLNDHDGKRPSIEEVKQALASSSLALNRSPKTKTGSGLIQPTPLVNPSISERSIGKTMTNPTSVTNTFQPKTCPRPPLKPYVYFLNNKNDRSANGDIGKLVYYDFTLEEHQYVEEFSAAYTVDPVNPDLVTLTLRFLIHKFEHGERKVNAAPTSGMITIPSSFDGGRTIKAKGRVKVEVLLPEEHHDDHHSELDTITHDGTTSIHGEDGDDDD